MIPVTPDELTIVATTWLNKTDNQTIPDPLPRDSWARDVRFLAGLLDVAATRIRELEARR